MIFQTALIILDSRLAQRIGDRHDLDVARSHMSFIFGHTAGRTFETIMEPPLFGDSRLSAGIQVCDIFSSLLFTNHYYYYARNVQGAPNYSHVLPFWTELDDIQFKCQNTASGYPCYGYRAVRLGR